MPMLLVSDAPLLNLTQLVISRILTARQGKLDSPISESGEIGTIRVLQGIDGTVDAELCGGDCCIQFETKISSGTLRPEQVRRHLKRLLPRPQNLKRLVLLTPDDGRSKYVEHYLSFDRNQIVHLGWKAVYDYLQAYIQRSHPTVFTQLLSQFLDQIRDCVFDQDLVGIIAKIDFSDKSGVDRECYLDELRDGAWDRWNTPRQYKNLDGTGRKLMLYDRTRGGITAEIEIQEVKYTKSSKDYPWSNIFAPGRVHVFPMPISLEKIRMLPNFENFGVHRKDRSPYRNLTQQQYMQLMDRQSS